MPETDIEVEDQILSDWKRKKMLWRATHPGSPFLLAICIVLIIATGIGEDRRSCDRQIGIRSALNYDSEAHLQTAKNLLARASVDTGKLHDQDMTGYYNNIKASRNLHVHVLDCKVSISHLPQTH